MLQKRLSKKHFSKRSSTSSRSNKKSLSFKEFRSSVNSIIDDQNIKSISSPSTQLPITVTSNLESLSILCKNTQTDNKYIPKFKIANSPAAATAIVYLNKGQSIYCNLANLHYFDNTVDISSKSQGIFSGIIRQMFTDSPMFLKYCTGMVDKPSVVAFSSFFGGDIVALRVKKGEKYVIADHCFLCGTSNIKLSTTSRLRNLFTNFEKVFLNEIQVIDGCEDDGIVWIASHGGLNKVTVNKGETVKITSGIYAFTNSNNNFTLGIEGHIARFLRRSNKKDYTVMKFTGPCDIYVHSLNFNENSDFMVSAVKGLKKSYNVIDIV